MAAGGDDGSDGEEDYRALAREQAQELEEARQELRRLQAEKDQAERSFEIYREAIAEHGPPGGGQAAESLELRAEAERLLQEHEQVSGELLVQRQQAAESQALAAELQAQVAQLQRELARASRLARLSASPEVRVDAGDGSPATPARPLEDQLLQQRAEREREEQLQALEQLRADRDRVHAQLEELLTQRDEVRQELRELTAEAAAAKSAAVREVVVEREAVSQEAERLLEEHGRVLADLAAARGESAELLHRLERSEAAREEEKMALLGQLADAQQHAARRAAEDPALEGLRAEAAAARELQEALRAQAAESERLRETYAKLEVEHGRLTMRARMDGDRSQLLGDLQAQVGLLMEERGAWHRQRDTMEEELATLRGELAALEASRRLARVEVEELRRLADQHATDRGVLDAEVSRLRAENHVLEAESRDLVLRLAETEARIELPGLKADLAFDGERLPVASGSPKPPALSKAEAWVLGEAARPLDTPYISYAPGVDVSFAGLGMGPLASAAAANAGQGRRVASMLESGDAARTALQAYWALDVERRGCLDWPSGQLTEFVNAVFRQLGLVVPEEAAVRGLVDHFAANEELSGGQVLDARSCLWLADALLRGTFFAEGAGGARGRSGSSPAATDIATPRGGPAGGEASQDLDDVEAKLRARLEQAELAADRALARARAGAAAGAMSARSAEGPVIAPQAAATPASAGYGGQPTALRPEAYGRVVVSPPIVQASAPAGGHSAAGGAAQSRWPQEPVAREPLAPRAGLLA